MLGNHHKLAKIALRLALLGSLTANADPGDGHANSDRMAEDRTLQNTVWETPLPSTNSTPLLLGDLVCTTANPVTLACFRRNDGTEVWRRENTIVSALSGERKIQARATMDQALALQAQFENQTAEYGKARLQSRRGGGSPELFARLEAMAGELENLRLRLEELQPYLTQNVPWVGWSSPTPAVYQDSLVALFGNGIIARVSKDGNLVWADYLGDPPTSMQGWEWGTTASPIVSGDLVLVPYGHFRALSLEDGSERWVDTQLWEHFGSPAIIKVAGEDYVATPDGRILRASDGSLVAENLAQVFYTTPVVRGNRIYWVGDNADNKQGMQVTCVEVLPGPDGKIQTRELFQTSYSPDGRQFSTPVFAGSQLFLSSEDGAPQLISSTTGESTKLDVSLIGPIMATPVVRGQYSYVSSYHGSLTAVPLDSTSPVVEWRTPPSTSTPTLDGDQLYLRTRDSLMLLRIDTP